MMKRIPKEIKDEILAKIRVGAKVRDMATQYAISDKSVYSWLSAEISQKVSLSLNTTN